jgi:hypothetical protein
MYCKHRIGRGRTWERPKSSLSEDGRREAEDEEIELEADTKEAEAVVQGIFSLLTAVSNGSTSGMESSHTAGGAGGLRMEQDRTGGMYTSTSFTESIATLPPFGPIEGNKWFDQISSQ